MIMKEHKEILLLVAIFCCYNQIVKQQTSCASIRWAHKHYNYK